jgi:DNA-binding NarL/FixJ family response regulator
VRASNSSASSVTRCRIILLATGGETNQAIADAIEIPEHTVSKWRRRFVKLGMA